MTRNAIVDNGFSNARRRSWVRYLILWSASTASSTPRAHRGFARNILYKGLYKMS